jgi:hypothetical protein
MFEIGKWYVITMIEGGDEGYTTYQVVDFQAPLLKIRAHDGDRIINTASQNFVSARLSQHQEGSTLDPMEFLNPKQR